jgi:1-acyl-sn-glycerol-3-phosphate acyltransferase
MSGTRTGSVTGLDDLPYALVVQTGKSLFRSLQLRRKVVGIENVPAEGGAVLAITHFGYLDFALTEWAVWDLRGRITRFLATTAAFRHPVGGPLMRAMRHIPVDRGAGADAYRQAVAALADGELVGVFPESYVSRDRTLLPLRTGAVRMAAQAGVPVVPTVVWGGHRVLTAGHRPSLREAWRAPISITFGTPLQVGADEDPRAATDRLRDALTGILADVRDDDPAEWAETPHDTIPQLRGGTSR